MISWQAHLLRLVFRLRRLFGRRPAALDVGRSRLETEALARYFRPTVRTTCTPVKAGDVPAEWVETPASDAGRVVLYLHGGAYNSGSIDTHRALAASISQAGEARVLVLDYRLAPEYRFPAPVEDALSAYRWLLAGGVGADRIAVAGDSCGGGMALALATCVRDAGEALPGALVCLSPWTDLTCGGPSWETNAARELLIDSEPLRQAATLYLDDADPRLPLASPLYADLAGLPPLLIQVGGDEILLSDATGLADRAEAAGVEVTLDVWEGMQHEWQFAVRLLPEARQAIERVGAFIRQRAAHADVGPGSKAASGLAQLR